MPRPLADEGELARLESLATARRAPLILALPGADVRLQELTITAAEKRHVGKSLPFMLEDEFASDLEELHIASQPQGKLQLAIASCEHSH